MVIWIREHPYMTGTLVLLVVIYFVLRRRASAAASSGVVTVGPSDSLQAAQLAAGAQVQTAQLAAQSTIAGYNAQLSAVNILSAADVAKTQIEANVYTQGILSSADVQNKQTAAALQLGLAQVGSIPTAPAPAPSGTPVVVGQGTAASDAAAAASSQQSAIDNASGQVKYIPPGYAGIPEACGVYGSDFSASYACSQRNAVLSQNYVPGNPLWDANHAVGCRYGVEKDAAGNTICSQAPAGTPNPVSVPNYESAYEAYSHG